MRNKFWLIRTDEPYFTVIINKLPLTEIDKKYFLNNKNLQNYLGTKIEKVYVSDEGSWNLNTESGKKGYIESGMEYMGEVEVTPEEIEASKYNL
jgi:hypothetical protein